MEAGFNLSVARSPLKVHGTALRILILIVKVEVDTGVLFPVPQERTEKDRITDLLTVSRRDRKLLANVKSQGSTRWFRTSLQGTQPFRRAWWDKL